jgi:hypothetical protein
LFTDGGGVETGGTGAGSGSGSGTGTGAKTGVGSGTGPGVVHEVHKETKQASQVIESQLIFITFDNQLSLNPIQLNTFV